MYILTNYYVHIVPIRNLYTTLMFYHLLLLLPAATILNFIYLHIFYKDMLQKLIVQTHLHKLMQIL